MAPATDLDALIEALARLSASQRGLLGANARAHVQELQGRVATIKRIVDERVDDAAARTQAADEVDKLIETVALLERSSSRKAPPPIKAAYRGVDLGNISAGLRVFAQWLRAPTPESTAAVEQMIASLRATTPPGWNDEAAAKKLEADIDADVRRSLEEIFGKQP